MAVAINTKPKRYENELSHGMVGVSIAIDYTQIRWTIPTVSSFIVFSTKRSGNLFYQFVDCLCTTQLQNCKPL